MNLSNCMLTIDGKPFLVTDVKIDFAGDVMKASVNAYSTQDIVYNHPKCKSSFCLNECEEDCKGDNMSSLNTVPKNLDKFINANFRAFYELGWVDEQLNLTNEGKGELVSFLLTQHEEEFGKVAQEKVAQIKSKEERK